MSTFLLVTVSTTSLALPLIDSTFHVPILSLRGVQVFAAEGDELVFDGIEDFPSALKKALSLARLTTAVTTA